MSRYKVLVDSSVWIDYFKNGGSDFLSKLLEEDLVCINELILTEIAPILIKNNQIDVVESLRSLEFIPLIIDWDGIRNYQILNLRNGINKVGIPDLIILQQVVVEKIALFSLDNHFSQIKKYVHFELIK